MFVAWSRYGEYMKRVDGIPAHVFPILVIVS